MPYEQITKIQSLGKKRTVDIEVNNPSHLFYGNDIATSNSHAISYALNSFMSAYYKSHTPRAFFTSYLGNAHNKQKPLEEINVLVNNAKLMNIDILVPDLRNKNTHFKLINKQIFFGLKDIKDVGKSAINQLFSKITETENRLKKGIAGFSWIEFLVLISQHVNSRCIKALISVGGLDYMDVARTKMLYEYGMYNKLSSREQNWCISELFNLGDFNGHFTTDITSLQYLLGLLRNAPTGKNGGCANINRQAKVNDFVKEINNPPYKLTDEPAIVAGLEESFLGISLTHSIVQSCDIKNCNCTCKEFIQQTTLHKISLIAVDIEDVHEIKTKRGKAVGSKMAFITASDQTGQMDSIVCFPDDWLLYKRLLVPNNTVIISGERGKENSFIIKKVYQI